FQNIFDSYIFKDVITIDDFSETEWDKAITVYFERFNIKCVLNKDAKAALKNPLLLRFFCEANRNQNLGKVNDLKLLSVFDLYIKRINKNIVQTAGFLKPDSILNLLLTISYRMWKERTTNISLSTIDITSVQSSDRTSLYNMIVSENVLIEERINVYTSKKNIRFIYDEFMEYMLARSWMDEVYSSRNLQLAIETLIQEAVEVIETFSPAFGAILFFDQMLKSNGSLINKTIVLMWKLGKHSQQFQMLRAFESINYDELDNNLIKTLQEFESELKVELKERFSGVVLRVLGKIPSVEYGKSYINKVLEVDDETEEYDLLKQKANSERLTALEIKEIYKNDISEEDIPRLPPARFHYTEETKLNAIGLLVRLNDDYQTIEKGIKKLGRTDIHSALQALEWIDLGHDDLVYKAVNEYINLPVPEYRIFSAWLLRNRYGVEPANFLINLLLDQQTRVSQYTNTLFRFREIETELIQRIIEKIENYKEIKHWYLNPLIKLLGNRDQFKPTNINTKIISKVVSCLNILTNHNKSTTRLESYRALVKYLDIVHVDELTNRMFQDTDTYIKSEAEKIYSKFS
ncbi:MAG: hypothetical protein JWQ09_4875, partial [Segetibacter sp.]|nr:hypothetical protein [Segetibacter sp.]